MVHTHHNHHSNHHLLTKQPQTPIMTPIDYKQQGKNNRRRGQAHEHKTRHHLEEQGYIVARWNNQIDLTTSPPTMIQAKSTRFNRGTTGFPDFIALKPLRPPLQAYNIILIECKVNNKLTPTEKTILNHYQHTLHIPCYISYKLDNDTTPHLRQHTHYTPKQPTTPINTPIPNQTKPSPHS